MENLELQNYGVATLSAREMKETDGGIIPILCGAAALCTLLYYAGYGARLAYDAVR